MFDWLGKQNKLRQIVLRNNLLHMQIPVTGLKLVVPGTSQVGTYVGLSEAKLRHPGCYIHLLIVTNSPNSMVGV
jgi:hypothetical protein